MPRMQIQYLSIHDVVNPREVHQHQAGHEQQRNTCYVYRDIDRIVVVGSILEE